MGQQVYLFSELKRKIEGGMRVSRKERQKVKWIRPEVKWANHEQVEADLKCQGRTELTIVAKIGDDLWLGVKGQSNLRIAGSLRNSWRWSVNVFIY